MNKKYLIVTILSYLLLFGLLYCLFTSKSNTYVTMTSIFIPILVGAIFQYDSNIKKKYNEYYEPIYHYIRTYHDVLSQPYSYISMGKKHEMMSEITQDILNFLNKNLKYSSEKVNEILEIILFNKYKNHDDDEFQDVYDTNRLIPIIMKEIIENYNMVYFNHFITRKFCMLLNKPVKANQLIYIYCDSFILDLAQKKEYDISLAECVETYNYIQKYREKNYKKYYRLYHFCKRNRNKEYKKVISKLNKKFGIKVKKIKFK